MYITLCMHYALGQQQAVHALPRQPSAVVLLEACGIAIGCMAQLTMAVPKLTVALRCNQ